VAGDQFQYVAAYGFPPGYLEHMQAHPRPIDRGSASGRAVVEGGVVRTRNSLCSMHKNSATFVLWWPFR
jgi:hypothetical protein